MLLLGSFNIRLLSDAILVSIWFHVHSKKLPKSRLGGALGRLGRVLGHFGRILGRDRQPDTLYVTRGGPIISHNPGPNPNRNAVNRNSSHVAFFDIFCRESRHVNKSEPIRQIMTPTRNDGDARRVAAGGNGLNTKESNDFCTRGVPCCSAPASSL